jgi:hypothetical protein
MSFTEIILVVIALPMLGFLLGYFFTRTNKKLDGLSAYMTKADCESTRKTCLHYRERDKDEVLDNLCNVEGKLDRLIEWLLEQRRA